MRLLAFMVFLAAPAAAHEGPPFPMYVDRALGPYSVSLWADPDVGTGTFFVLVDAPAGADADDTEADLYVRPARSSRPEAHWKALREPTRRGLRFVARPVFDTEEEWDVRLVLSGRRGRGEAAQGVDVTPPDAGPAGMWLYMLPFLAVGFLWGKALWARAGVSARRN